MDTNMKLTGIVRTIAASVRADDTVPKSEKVTVFLEIDYSDCTLEDVLQFACADRRIAWANGANGRKAIGGLKANQRIAVRAKSPGAKDLYTSVQQLAAAAGMSPQEWLEAEAKKRQAPKLEKLGK